MKERRRKGAEEGIIIQKTNFVRLAKMIESRINAED